MRTHSAGYDVTADDVRIVVVPDRSHAWVQIGSESSPYFQLMPPRFHPDDGTLADDIEALIALGERIAELARAEMVAHAEEVDA